MAANNVKPNWQGKSKEELVDMPSWLPQDVRDHPRAYLVPAHQGQSSSMAEASHQREVEKQSTNTRLQSTSSSLKCPHESALTSQISGLFLSPPPFPRPSAQPGAGQCVSSAWNWKNSSWTMTYESGASVTIHVPTQGPDTAPQHRSAGQIEPRAKRARIVIQPAQQQQVRIAETPSPTAVQPSTPRQEQGTSTAMDVDRVTPSHAFAEMTIGNVNELPEVDYKSDSD